MSTSKISELTNLGTAPASDDSLVIVDTSAGETKKVSFSDLNKHPDNVKATFGASDDLQIYHDGSGSYIDDVGTGNLFVRADSLQLRRADGSQIYLVANTGAEVALYHAGNSKLATTATGIDVTGTVTADGLTVDGNADISSSSPYLDLTESDTVDVNTRILNTGGDLWISTINDAKSTSKRRITVDHATGDISFYEDTGTTAKFFWDASAEALAIGHTVTSHALSLANTKELAFLDNTGASRATLTIDASNYIQMGSAGGGLSGYKFDLNGSNAITIDGSRRVGIGTTSPSTHLDVTGGTTNQVAIFRSSDATATIGFADDTTPLTGNLSYVTVGAVGNNMVFNTNLAEAMRISSAGNVGINTTNVTNLLTIGLDSFAAGAADTSGMYTDSTSKFLTMLSDGYTWNTRGGTERARLDASGNLLVGTTSEATWTTTAGFRTRPSGSTTITRSAAPVLYANRLTSDGAIQEFLKDGTTVGSIGSRSSLVSYIVLDPRAGGGGLGGTTGTVHPCDNNGSPSDNTVSLGSSSARFKDLYLSGGVYLGGTGAANHLDDYEEGTWTPEYAGTTTAGVGTYTFQNGSYIKVGNLVTVNGFFRSTAHTGTGNITISNLPFTVSTGNDEYGVLNIGECFNLAKSADTMLTGYANPSSTLITLRQITTAATTTSTSNVPMDTGFDILFTCTYRTV